MRRLSFSNLVKLFCIKRDPPVLSRARSGTRLHTVTIRFGIIAVGDRFSRPFPPTGWVTRMTTWYPLIMGREAMVATEHYLSAAAGARIFAKGGNAIDAAVAATLVEGVVKPHLHTIGGEAAMLH